MNKQLRMALSAIGLFLFALFLLRRNPQRYHENVWSEIAFYLHDLSLFFLAIIGVAACIAPKLFHNLIVSARLQNDQLILKNRLPQLIFVTMFCFALYAAVGALEPSIAPEATLTRVALLFTCFALLALIAWSVFGMTPGLKMLKISPEGIYLGYSSTNYQHIGGCRENCVWDLLDQRSFTDNEYRAY